MAKHFDVAAVGQELLSRYEIDPADLPGLAEALDVMLGALREEPLLSDEGLDRQLRMIDDHLATLAAITADRHRYPGIAEVEITKPIFITGLGRSGTTFLHELLSHDPANRCPLVWETQYPSPPPEAATYDSDPRIAECERAFRANPAAPKDDLNNAEAQQKHMNGPLIAEEDSGLMRISLRALPLGSYARILGYFHWLLQQDSTPQYQMHKRFLQHLQWRNPRERWLLKAPTHMHNLPALFATYPDAQIVWCHRDPAEVVSSMTSVLCTLRSRMMTAIDPPAIALEMINYWSSGLLRGMAFRRAHPEIPIFDIGHSAIVADPIGAVRRLYDHFGIELTARAQARMTAFVDENPREKLGGHRHGIERYGLSAPRLHEVFEDYIASYGAYIGMGG